MASHRPGRTRLATFRTVCFVAVAGSLLVLTACVGEGPTAAQSFTVGQLPGVTSNSDCGGGSIPKDPDDKNPPPNPVLVRVEKIGATTDCGAPPPSAPPSPGAPPGWWVPQDPGGNPNPEGPYPGGGGIPGGGGGGGGCTQFNEALTPIAVSMLGGDCVAGDGSWENNRGTPYPGLCESGATRCLVPLTQAQRILINSALALFRPDMLDICARSAANVRSALLGQSGGSMYSGNLALPDAPGSMHDAQSQWWISRASGQVTRFVMHVDEDFLTSVASGAQPLRSLANLLLHEGMHTMIDPTTGSIYDHSGTQLPPYPVPFNWADSGSTACVQ